MKVIHVLLAEDNIGDVRLVSRALREHHIDHELQLVEDGEQALAHIKTMGKPGFPPCPDVLLLDLNLPMVDGPEVLREFRKHPACAHTPVIVVSSSYAVKDREPLTQFGIARYFRKPSDLVEFMKLGAVVKEVVEGKSG
jgi:CheY-like chemotaxis protein